MKKILVSLLLLLSFYVPSFASSWYYIGHEKYNNRQYFIDNASVVKNFDGSTTVWARINFPNGNYQLQRINVTKDRRHALLSAIEYDTDGNIINRYTVPSYMVKYFDVIPGSMGEALYEAIYG